MFASLLRLAREGTLVVALAVPVVSVPAISHAGWFEDVKDLAVALPQLFNPSHDLGKLGLGGLMFGGAPILALIPVVGVPLAIGSAVIGLGLLAWGAYNINHWDSDEGGTPGNIPGGTNPNPPGGGGEPSRRPIPGGPTTFDPPGGVTTTSGNNVGRDVNTTTTQPRLPSDIRLPGRGTGAGTHR